MWEKRRKEKVANTTTTKAGRVLVVIFFIYCGAVRPVILAEQDVAVGTLRGDEHYFQQR